MQALGQGRGWVYRLLAHEHEVVALLTALLDYGSLSSGGATFAESLYSLRCPQQGTPPGARPLANAGAMTGLRLGYTQVTIGFHAILQPVAPISVACCISPQPGNTTEMPGLPTCPGQLAAL